MDTLAALAVIAAFAVVVYFLQPVLERAIGRLFRSESRRATEYDVHSVVEQLDPTIVESLEAIGHGMRDLITRVDTYEHRYKQLVGIVEGLTEVIGGKDSDDELINLGSGTMSANVKNGDSDLDDIRNRISRIVKENVQSDRPVSRPDVENDMVNSHVADGAGGDSPDEEPNTKAHRAVILKRKRNSD